MKGLVGGFFYINLNGKMGCLIGDFFIQRLMGESKGSFYFNIMFYGVLGLWIKNNLQS